MKIYKTDIEVKIHNEREKMLVRCINNQMWAIEKLGNYCNKIQWLNGMLNSLYFLGMMEHGAMAWEALGGYEIHYYNHKKFFIRYNRDDDDKELLEEYGIEDEDEEDFVDEYDHQHPFAVYDPDPLDEHWELGEVGRA